MKTILVCSILCLATLASWGQTSAPSTPVTYPDVLPYTPPGALKYVYVNVPAAFNVVGVYREKAETQDLYNISCWVHFKWADDLPWGSGECPTAYMANGTPPHQWAIGSRCGPLAQAVCRSQNLNGGTLLDVRVMMRRE